MLSIPGRITPGSWELGAVTGGQTTGGFSSTASPSSSFTSDGGTPLRVMVAIPGVMATPIQLGAVRGDIAGGSALRGRGTFVGTAAPQSTFFGETTEGAGYFTGTADPTSSFGVGGAFTGTADPRSSFDGESGPATEGRFTSTADPISSFSPLGGTNETCLIQSQPDAQTAPNYVY